MEKRALLAVVLSLLILVLYQEWMTRYYPAPAPPETQREEKKPETTAPTPPKPEPALQTAKPTTSAGAKPRPVQEVHVETDDYVALFTSQGARLKSFKLKHYRTSADEKSPPFEMVPSVPGVPYPLGVTLAGSNPSDDENIAYAIQGGDLKLAGTSEGRLVFQGTSPAGVALTKELTFTGSGYSIRIQVSAGGAAAARGLTITAEAAAKTAADAPFEGMLADVDGKLVREHGDSLKGKEWSGKVSWAGFGHTYFLFAVLPEGNGEQKITVREAGPALVMEIAPRAAAAQVTHTLFIGPKEIETLKSMGRGLERSIDFGWFHLVSVPLLYILHFFHNFTGSWGMDIILLTVLIKLIMAPLTHKSFVSMKQMQKLQPQMERLKEKHKDNKEALNKEIMELYRRNKVNPFGGCLPMLLQFPVFIALYNALLTPIELRHAPFLWIKDLSRPDWESLPVEMFGFQFGIPILTLLMGASMFVQQWMTPTAGDPNQRRMMLMMPIVFTFMFINFPSGLTIYWLVNNLLSIAQQYLINRSQH